MPKISDFQNTQLDDYQTGSDRYSMICCPFLNDSMTSLSIIISSGNLRCFGSGTRGDLVFLIACLTWIPLTKAITKNYQLHAEMTHG
jgi:DNA primase